MIFQSALDMLIWNSESGAFRLFSVIVEILLLLLLLRRRRRRRRWRRRINVYENARRNSLNVGLTGKILKLYSRVTWSFICYHNSGIGTTHETPSNGGSCWLTVVEVDRKAPFSVATTRKCRGGRYSFPCISPLIHNPFLIMLNFWKGGIKYYFLSLSYDSIWDWNLVSWIVGENFNHYANGICIKYESEEIYL